MSVRTMGKEWRQIRVFSEHKQMHEELIKEKGLHTITLNSIGDGVIATDLKGKVNMLNKAAEKLTGWSQAEALGKPLAEVFKLINKEKNEIAQSPYQKVMESGLTVGLNKYTALVHRDGMERLISASSAPIRDKKGNTIGVVVVFRDITRIKKAEEELANEKRNLQAIIDGAPVGMLIIDENTVIKQINEATLRKFGKTKLAVINKRIGSGFGCINSYENLEGCGYSQMCSACQLRKTLELVLNSGEPIYGLETQHEFLLKAKEITLWLRINAVPITINEIRHVMVVIDDITERMRAEEGLKRYQLLSEYARDIMLFVGLDGRIIEANNAALEAYGYEREELLSMKVHQLRTPKNGCLVDSHMKQANYNGILFETVHYRKDGSSFPVEISSQGAKIGKEIVLLSIIRDVTERRRVEEELYRAKEAAEIANRAKSQFLANMSHEIRTPMNGIIGMTNLTLATNLTNEQRDNLLLVKSCANSLLKLINNILDISKIEAGKMIVESVAFNFRNLIDQIIKAHTVPAEEKGLELICNIQQDIPEVLLGDPGKLQQVLNNLIGNAVKFTDIGKVVVSIVKSAIEGQQIKLKFSVEDTGIGISKDEISGLFRSFSQVDSSITRRYGGSGLGLAISKQLVEIMGGNIWVESEKGKVTTFHFTTVFSITDQLKLKKQPVYQYSISKTKKPLAILVAEDEEINKIMVNRLLSQKGHQVEVVSNGEEALAILAKKEFDLVLMDVQMPEMDGIEATRRIREKEKSTNRHLPIIALTAYALQGDREKFLAVGMDGYLAKPVDSEDLFATIEQLAQSQATKTREIPFISDKQRGELSQEDLAVFLEVASNRLQILKEALAANNTVLMERIAHQLKDQAAKINLKAIKNMAFKIELAIRKENLTEADRIYGKILEELDRLRKGEE